MILGALGWILIGAVIFTALAAFWDRIRDWLNNEAANFVERVLGYKARNAMYRAVCVADRVIQGVRVKARIYTKKNDLDDMYDEVIIEGMEDERDLKPEELATFNKEKEVYQEYIYRG